MRRRLYLVTQSNNGFKYFAAKAHVNQDTFCNTARNLLARCDVAAFDEEMVFVRQFINNYLYLYGRIQIEFQIVTMYGAIVMLE